MGGRDSVVMVARFGGLVCILGLTVWGMLDSKSGALMPPWFPLSLVSLYLFFVARHELMKLSDDGSDEDLLGYDFSQGYTSLEPHGEGVRREPGPLRRWLEQRREQKERRIRQIEEDEERRVDEVLARVKDVGLDALSPEERALLERTSASDTGIGARGEDAQASAGPHSPLISWHAGVDLRRPGFDSACHALGIQIAVLPQPGGSFQASAPEMAMHHDAPVGRRRNFGNPLAKLAHWHEHGPVDPRERIFVWLAAIHEQQILARLNRALNLAAIDFDGKHGAGVRDEGGGPGARSSSKDGSWRQRTRAMHAGLLGT